MTFSVPLLTFIVPAFCRQEIIEADINYAILEILTEGETRGQDVTKSDEFVKSGIVIKTIRLNKNGRPAEAMSFENINYFDILKEDDWYESRLYDIFTGRFLFIVFQEGEDDKVRLKKAFFWTMPLSRTW